MNHTDSWPPADTRDFLVRLARILPPQAIVAAPARGITTYEGDGFGVAGGDPMAVVLPETTEQVSALMRLAQSAGVPVMPRGAGTSRCGGAIPLARSLVLGTSRMRRIVGFDPLHGRVRVQPGVRNLEVSDHVREAGWFYAPDPSSRRTCTIGGNIASNASGACAVRHGATARHLRGATVVLHDGAVVALGEHAWPHAGEALMAFLCGSEGQLAFVTEATLQLEPLAEHAETLVAGFVRHEDALACASQLLRGGLQPMRLEFMDRHAVDLTERIAPCGYPTGAGGTLLVELQGLRDEVEEDMTDVAAQVRAQGATHVQRHPAGVGGPDPWQGREAMYRAASRDGAFECLDCCVPLGRLNEALQCARALAEDHGLAHATVAHAGDGTLHTFLLPRRGEADGMRRASECGNAIRLACVRLGGSISAEYGVGLGRRELLAFQFKPLDLQQQRRVRAAFAPDDGLNPGKVFPFQGHGSIAAPLGGARP